MHETIEGEVIVIDLTTGSYYSLRDAGAEIWHSVEQGTDEAEIDEGIRLVAEAISGEPGALQAQAEPSALSVEAAAG